MTDAMKKELAKIDCYFFPMKGKCKFGESCFMKQTYISEEKKALLKHPSEQGPLARKPKQPAAPAVEWLGGGEVAPRGRSPGRGKGRGRDEETDEKGKGNKRNQSRAGSPAPSHTSARTDGGGKSNKEIHSEFKLPGFCKEYKAGTCTREITKSNPKGCSRGAHMSSEAYAKLKEKTKASIKEAKSLRNSRSQSGPPVRE